MADVLKKGSETTINLTIEDIKKLGEESASSREEAKAAFKSLQDRIKNGEESTGDTIKDFAIACFLELDSKREDSYENKLRSLDSRIKENIGNHFLVVKERETIHGCPGIVSPPSISPQNIGIDTVWNLGKLSGELEFDFQRGSFNEGELLLPTKKYTQKDGGFNRPKIDVKKGPLRISVLDFLNLGNKLERKTSPIPNNMFYNWQHGLHLYFGEEVKVYFGRREEERMKQFERLNTNYVVALDLLNLGEEVPQDFREIYDGEIFEEKKNIMKKLREFAGKVDERQKSSVQNLLEQAFELDMHKTKWIIDLKIPGESRNVPEYVKGIARIYDIKIPSD